MIKQKTKTPSKTNVKRAPLSRQKCFFMAGAVVLCALVIFQIVFDAYVYRSSIRPGDETILTNLLVSATDALHKPAPVDAKTGDVYLPEAKLMLPAPTDSFMQILYGNVGGTGSAAQLQVTTSSIVHQAESKLWAVQAGTSGWRRQPNVVFAQVPNLQACTRGVQLFFGAQPGLNSQFRLQATKVLNSGQTVYMYTESTCHEDLSSLVAYLKQVQSY